MSNPIIKVENIGKQYRLGNVGTGTLSHDITRWWYSVRGKEDPYLKIGEVNDRTQKGGSDYVWALRDISFEVQPGEILGIIGKNGAGKSTLLKLLSQVTAPTTGKITSYGSIASLLEVGTGFHPELTGKENIYLNGAILGMTKKQIASQFDEIVDFAGCAKYIETPVKRYSSGMYVRLAFAVAAHLEPDILVVDEVLAVGDAEFQKKAIGKMQEVSQGEGRTVLFVSHNMNSIRELCNKAMLMHNGQIKDYGNVDEIIEKYESIHTSLAQNRGRVLRKNLQKTGYIEEVFLTDFKQNEKNTFDVGENFTINLKIKVNEALERPEISIRLNSIKGVVVATWRTYEIPDFEMPEFKKDRYISLNISDLNIIDGLYSLNMTLLNSGAIIDTFEDGLFFEVINKGNLYRNTNNNLKFKPLIYSSGKWTI